MGKQEDAKKNVPCSKKQQNKKKTNENMVPLYPKADCPTDIGWQI